MRNILKKFTRRQLKKWKNLFPDYIDYRVFQDRPYTRDEQKTYLLYLYEVSKRAGYDLYDPSMILLEGILEQTVCTTQHYNNDKPVFTYKNYSIYKCY